MPQCPCWVVWYSVIKQRLIRVPYVKEIKMERKKKGTPYSPVIKILLNLKTEKCFLLMRRDSVPAPFPGSAALQLPGRAEISGHVVGLAELVHGFGSL